MLRSLSKLQATILGVVVLAGLAFAGIGIFAVGDQQLLWSDKLQVTAGFRQVRGLEVGTPVRVQGIKAGQVVAVEAPAEPGGDVMSGRMRNLIRSDAAVQIVSEGMLGGKALEINPGTPSAQPIQEHARLASRPTAELNDMLGQVNMTLEGIREGQGTVGKLLTDPQAYNEFLALVRQGKGTMASIQQDADALKSMPVVGRFVPEDPEALLVRPNCERNRRYFAEPELFEPGRAVLTADGRRRLDELAPWLEGLKHKGSEIVVVAYADPRSDSPSVARAITKKQSEAVCDYLKGQHAVQKMGWFTSRKVAPLGLGTSAPPLPEKEPLPPARVEVLVFVPQG